MTKIIKYGIKMLVRNTYNHNLGGYNKCSGADV